ncbi:MAG: PQQ-binding-like beta-propeller repeat protein [Candidatus Brocadiaceae bacterium]|nr:PQQ-binding-like beta-propeller repeat protein [Candidatus Brocadiaceae bacterium]
MKVQSSNPLLGGRQSPLLCMGIFTLREFSGKLLNRRGELLWNKPFENDTTLFRSNYLAPILNEGVLLLRSETDSNYDYSTSLFYYSMESGEKLWKKSEAMSQSLFSMSNGTQLFTIDGEVTAIDLKSNKTVWQSSEELYLVYKELTLESGPALVGNSSVIDGNSGKAIWKYPEHSTFITVVDSLLFVQLESGDVSAFNCNTWEVSATWELPSGSYRKFVTRSNDECIFTSSSNRIFNNQTELLSLNLTDESSKMVTIGKGMIEVLGFWENNVLLKTMKSIGAYTLTF